MGRAIHMENKLDELKRKVISLEAVIRGLMATVEELKPKRKAKVDEANEQKGDKKTAGASSNSSDKGLAKPKRKTKQS